MQYNVLGKTGLRVSRLGFGCMRLPMLGAVIDREKAIPMLQLAYDLGINYFDTAIFYCSGDSQRVLGEAMEGRRSGIVLSTKNNFYEADQPGEWRRRLEESLRLLRTDYLDIYNFHGLSWESFTTSVMPPHGLYREMERAREEGLIRHICCSFHDVPENLVRLAETGLFASFTLQYNLIDRSNEAGIRRLAELGCGVVIMGPVAGGRLGDHFSKHLKMSAAEVALRFVLGNPDVNIALSGMGNETMLRQNVAAIEALPASEGQPADPAASSVGVEVFLARMRQYYCTACRYCLPCPQGVSIPENMTALINDEVFGLPEIARSQYLQLTGAARHCTACGQCLAKCPQKLEIDHLMSQVVERFDPDYGKIAAEVEVDQSPRAETIDGAPHISFPVTLNLMNLMGRDLINEPLVFFANGMAQTSLLYSAKPGMSRKFPCLVKVQPDASARVEFSIDRGATGRPGRFIIATAEGSAPAWNRIDTTSHFQIGSPERLAGHACRFAFCAAKDELIFSAQVKDDCLGCLAETGVLVITDCIELYLAPGTTGVIHALFLFPGTRAGAPPFIKTVNAPLAGESPRLTSRFTEEGYDLVLRIPYPSLGIQAGDFLKTDVIFNSADRTGGRFFAAEFGHAPRYWSEPNRYPLLAWPADRKTFFSAETALPANSQ